MKIRSKLEKEIGIYMGEIYLLGLLLSVFGSVFALIICFSILSYIGNDRLVEEMGTNAQLFISICIITFTTLVIFTSLRAIFYKKAIISALKKEKKLIQFRVRRKILVKLIKSNNINFELFRCGKIFSNKNCELIYYHIDREVNCSILYKTINASFFTYKFRFYKGSYLNEDIIENTREEIQKLFRKDQKNYEKAFGKAMHY